MIRLVVISRKRYFPFIDLLCKDHKTSSLHLIPTFPTRSSALSTTRKPSLFMATRTNLSLLTIKVYPARSSTSTRTIRDTPLFIQEAILLFMLRRKTKEMEEL